nr:unnamed protein product [Digitaria exilis]
MTESSDSTDDRCKCSSKQRPSLPPRFTSAAGGQRKKKSGSTSSSEQSAHRAPDMRLSAPSKGTRPLVGLPKDPLPKPPAPGVGVKGDRPLGALAAGVPPPASELHAK